MVKNVHVWPPPILESFSVLITLTITLLIVLGINFKSRNRKLFWGPISGVCKGNLYLSSPAPGCACLWDYTYTPEIILTLLNSFRVNFQNITLTLTLVMVFKIRM